MSASVTFPPMRTKHVKITSSTTWTVPSGVHEIFAKPIGGGAGGGNGSSGAGFMKGAGGGGAGFISEQSIPVTPGEALSINIGGGGGPNSDGGATTLSRGGTVLVSAAGGNTGGPSRGGLGSQTGHPPAFEMVYSGGQVQPLSSGYYPGGGGSGLEGTGGVAGISGPTGYGSGGAGGQSGTSGAVFIYYAQTT